MNQIDYCYKLNLPDFYQVADPDFDLETFFQRGPILSSPASQILRPEYIDIAGYKLEQSVCFRKLPGVKSIVHSDGQSFDEPFIRWGINWLIGEGGMHYWHPDQRDRYTLETDSEGSPRMHIHPDRPPDRTYYMPSHSVYLVNASVPHQAFNSDTQGIRYAMSIRPRFNTVDTWDTVVARFSSLICN